MKLFSFKSLLFIGLVIGFAACEKNNYSVDVAPVTPPEKARFLTLTTTANLYVLELPAPGTSYKLPVGITTVSSTDRKVKFTYSGTAIRGTNFNAPDEITIPAGAAVDTLTIQTLFASFPQNVSKTLKVKIIDEAGFVSHNAYKDSFVLTMQRPCDVVLENVAGDYTRTFENGTYGPYTSTVSPLVLVPGSTTSATATIDNIYDSGISAVATFDWSNPAAYKVTIADQSTGFTSGGLPLSIRSVASPASSFSSCNNTITINFQLYTSAGIVDSWQATMAH